MDDVLDSVCSLHSGGDHHRPFFGLVSSLLRTENGFRLLVAVSLHQRSQRPLQEVPTPYAGIQGEGH